MTPSERRVLFAQKAYDQAEDKLAVEKVIYVNDGSFHYCTRDLNDHHKECARRRGYLRTYHKPFWTENPGGMGKTYNMGIVNIVNEDAEINKKYEIKPRSKDVEKIINYRIGTLRHKLIDISVCQVWGITLTFLSQRNEFDD